MADHPPIHHYIRLGIALLILVIVTGGPLARVPVVHAQDNEPQIIRSHDVEVVFPAAVRFRLRLLVAPEELSGLSLTISQEERILREGEIDLAAAIENSGDPSAPRVDWPIPTTDSPALFTPTIYRWTLTFPNGEEYEFEGEFFIADVGQAWRHARGAPLSLSTFEDVAINRSREAILPAYDLLTAHTGLEPEFEWIVLPRQHTFCVEQEDTGASIVLAPDETAYPCSEDRAERFFTRAGYRLLRREMPGLIALQNELIADMFSVFYGDYWGAEDVPAWFRIGLAQLYGISPDLSALRRMQDVARRDGLLESAALNEVPAANTEARIIWNNQVYTMTLYLADLYGADAPFDLARAVPETGFDQAFRDLTGDDLDAFLVDWARWLFSDEAERAVAWTIYLSTTATLPPTHTQTPVPPTSTITPTATDTPLPTFTPTATGIVQQQPSPLPTYTPAPATLSIPTNTPRPPGSLDQPSAQGSGDSGGGGLCPASLPALLLPAAALFLTQQRKKHQ